MTLGTVGKIQPVVTSIEISGNAEANPRTCLNSYTSFLHRVHFIINHNILENDCPAKRLLYGCVYARLVGKRIRKSIGRSGYKRQLGPGKISSVHAFK